MLDTLEVTVSPQEVNLKVEEKISAFVPVLPLINGSPAHGYEIKNITVKPDTVELTGPRSMVQNCTRLQTKAVSVKNADKSFASPVLPENPGSYLKFKNNEEKLTVTVEIAPVVSEKSFSVEMIDVKSLPKEFVVSSQKNSGILNLSGKLVDLEKFSVSQGSLFVNASEISEPGIYELDVKASVPAKFTVQDFSPKKIKVAVEKIKVVDELEEKVGDVITSPVNEILPEKIELTGGQSGE